MKRVFRGCLPGPGDRPPSFRSFVLNLPGSAGTRVLWTREEKVDGTRVLIYAIEGGEREAGYVRNPVTRTRAEELVRLIPYARLTFGAILEDET